MNDLATNLATTLAVRHAEIVRGSGALVDNGAPLLGGIQQVGAI